MGISRACVGDVSKEFGGDSSLVEVWEFVNSLMATASGERAIVLVDDMGRTMGEIWDSSLYYAHWETPSKMAAYFCLIGFDQDDGTAGSDDVVGL